MPRPSGGEGPAGQLVLVHGDEPFLVDRLVAALLGPWRAGLSNPLNDEVFRAPRDLGELRLSLATPAFLDDHRVVLVWDPPGLVAGGRRGSDAAPLLAALRGRDPTSAVCLAVHAAVPATNPVVEHVRTTGTVRAVARPRGRALDVHLDAELAAHGLRLAAPSRARLRAVAAVDLNQLDRELEKLSVAAGPDGRLDRETADALIADGGRSEIHHLLDALLEGPGAALRHLADLDLRRAAPPPLLVASLGRWLRELLQLHAAQARGVPLGRAIAGRPPWMAQRLERQVRRTDAAALAAALEQLADLDWAIRSGDVDPQLGLQAFVAGLASGQHGRRSAA